MSSFEALMALASKQTEASQIALAKETQIRQAREKAKRLEEERKEKERIRLEKERLAKQKLEDERREKRLIEERQRKNAERLAALEIANKQHELNSNTPSSSSNLKNRTKPITNNRSTARPSNSNPVNHLNDPEEQRMLDREEKKARARAKIFGEPISAHKKPATSNSNQRLKKNSKVNPSQRSPSFNEQSRMVTGSSTTLTARQRIVRQFSANDRKPLNQFKKDRRTIEEIEQDMKRKKLPAFDQRVPSPSKPHPTNSVLKKEFQTIPRPTSETTSTVKRRISGLSAAPPSKRALVSTSITRTSIKGIDPQRSNSASQPPSARNHKMRVDQSDDDDSESEDLSDEDATVAPSIRDEIWKIMGKDRKQYTTKPIYSDEEGSDDMEADVDDVLEEEGRAAHLARLEDQREQERLRQHELEKKKRLLQNRLSK